MASLRAEWPEAQSERQLRHIVPATHWVITELIRWSSRHPCEKAQSQKVIHRDKVVDQSDDLPKFRDRVVDHARERVGVDQRLNGFTDFRFADVAYAVQSRPCGSGVRPPALGDELRQS